MIRVSAEETVGLGTVVVSPDARFEPRRSTWQLVKNNLISRAEW